MAYFAHLSAEYVALGANILAILAIAIGCAQGAVGLSYLLLFGGSEDRLRPVWLAFGRWLVAALTFQLAADIVETTLAPDWDDIGKLGVIAAIRTALNYFLDRDMDMLRERGRNASEEAKPEAELPAR